MDMGQAVACRIKEPCAQRGITVCQLAKGAGLSAAAVSGLANGKGKSPSFGTVLALCAALRVTPAEFFRSPLFEQME